MNKITLKNPGIVALDLDGTLLKSDHTLSQRTIETLRVLEKQCRVVISTGRSYEGMKHFKDQIGLENPVICYNGAMIADGRTDKILHQWLLPSDITRAAYEYARERGIHFQAFQDGELYFEKKTEESEYYEASTALQGHLTSFDHWENLEVTKALMIISPSRSSGDFPELHEARSYFKEQFAERLYCALSKPFYLEFINGKGSKGNALHQVGTDMQVSQDRIAAFGDGFNDLEMLEYAGMSVAMSNAPQGVKERCTHETELSNDEDGVADFIEKYFLR
ncbi:HAD family phosphatase [Oceanispirochaeta crateris]|uniref:HAD family phosphatase n=1 Tax=Oceanispirochaeta crateris TaxID=2518645 RepID=A0A5C1QH98_9SPIO|nr:Cof-type HAD-IIB family hydrolase [Oceanispirochaeta crateris]QEN06941.1 HAD family phosphatase [Oceanispirochaeta crateris]